MALAFRRHPGGADTLHEAILAEIASAPAGALPGRHPLTLHAHEDPDHGAMSELTNLLHAFARTRDPRGASVLAAVAARLELTDARFRDKKSAVFYYVDALADIAERLGSADCAPTLRALLEQPALRDPVLRATHHADYFADRKAYAALVLSRALARCGGRDGYERLLAFAEDRRRSLREHARNELRLLAPGCEPAPAAWAAWLASRDTPPRPWREEDDPFARILPNE